MAHHDREERMQVIVHIAEEKKRLKDREGPTEVDNVIGEDPHGFPAGGREAHGR